MSELFDAYHQWLGIPPTEQPPNHYRLLGLALFEADPNVIANAADRQMAHLRSFATGKHSADSQRLLNEVAAAKVALLKNEKKTAYDAALRAKLRLGPPAIPKSPDEPRARQTGGPPPLAGQTTPERSDIPQFQPSVGRSVAQELQRSRSGPAIWISGALVLVLAAVGGAVVWKLVTKPETELAGNESGLPAAKRAQPNEHLKQSDKTDQAAETGVIGTTSRNGSETDATDAQPKTNETSNAPATRAEQGTTDAAERSQSKPRPVTRRGRTAAKAKVQPPRGARSSNTSNPTADNANGDDSKTPASNIGPTTTDAAPPQPNPRAVGTRQALPTLEKTPPPTSDQRQAIEQEIRVALADEFAAAKKPASKKTAGTSPLAMALMQRTATASQDAVTSYVLLDLAREAAMEAGDAPLALRALDRLATAYEIDEDAARLATLNKLAATATQVTSQRATFEAAWQAAVRFAQNDEYDEATKSLKLAQSVAARAKENESARQIAQRIKDVAVLAREYTTAKASLEKLADSPDDPEANLVAGRWYWLGKGRFDKAVAHLAKGSDAELKAAAENDLAAPADTGQQVALANLWMAAADKRKADEKNAIEARAFYWYLKASANAAPLDDKVAIEKRIEELRDRIEKRLLADASKPALGEASNAAGFLVAGVVVEYFADAQLQRKLASATSNMIRTEFAHERELGLPPATRFTARWTGWIVPNKSGPYKIRINPRGAFWLDGKPLIGPRTSPPEATVEVSARPHHIRYEVPDITLGASALLHFHPAAEPPMQVPPEALFHVPLPGEAPVELKRMQINPALRENL